MSLLEYLIKANLALVLCLALYWVAFRKLTFFQWNRFYLLGSVVLSLILPLLKLPFETQLLAAADIGGIDWAYLDHMVSMPVTQAPFTESGSPRSLVLPAYLLVSLALLLRGAWKLRHLLKGLESASLVSKGRIKIYVQEEGRGSFTLFRRIYLDRSAHECRSGFVVKHEMAHAVQLHSFDLIFMEFVMAMLWFNPFVFVLFRQVRDNHEYLADRYAHGDRGSLAEYLECLKAEAVRILAPVPASYFKSSTIKKRIIMLTNHRSKKSNKWRYLGILPLFILIVFLLQGPGVQDQAIAASLGIEISPGAGSLSPEGEIPNKFPLPQKYKGKITWGFDKKAIHPITKKETVHLGIDVAAPTGTPVYAAGGGTVIKAAEEKGWGKLVALEHSGGYTTFYSHLDEIAVETGAKVSAGQVIGKVGNTGQSTGSHLHYEVRKDGRQVDPADYY